MLLCWLCPLCSCDHVVIGNMNIQHCYNDLSQLSVVFHSGLKTQSSQSQSDLCSGQPKQSQRYNGWHIELFKIHDSFKRPCMKWMKKKKKKNENTIISRPALAIRQQYIVLHVFFNTIFCVFVFVFIVLVHTTHRLIWFFFSFFSFSFSIVCPYVIHITHDIVYQYEYDSALLCVHVHSIRTQHNIIPINNFTPNTTNFKQNIRKAYSESMGSSLAVLRFGCSAFFLSVFVRNIYHACNTNTLSSGPWTKTTVKRKRKHEKESSVAF